jgi:hypothetical protein
MHASMTAEHLSVPAYITLFSVAFPAGQTVSEEGVERSSSKLGSAGRNVSW